MGDYTVGRGKPPRHTRFKKGRSGNPSGKPGPAKLARRRFQRALCSALEGDMADLERAQPRDNLNIIVRRLALDAAAGNIHALRFIVRELDKEAARELCPAGEESLEQSADASAPWDRIVQ